MADYVLCLVYDPRKGRHTLEQLSEDEIRKRCSMGLRVLRDPAAERDQDIQDVYRSETQTDDTTLYRRIKRRQPRTT